MDKQIDEKDIIRIKRTRGYVPLFLMLSIVLLALSIYCVIYAYTSNLNGASSAIFYIAGAIGILFFTYSAFDNLFQTIQPKNALIIGSEGFADFTVGGVGIGMVKWDNIKSIKTVRSKDGRLLMVELNDFNAIVDNAPKYAQKAVMRADWDDNSIAIRQIDVAERLSVITEMFNKHINAAGHNNSEEENSKTKVMSDADVKSLFHTLSEQEEAAPVEAKQEKKEPRRFEELQGEVADSLSETAAIPDIPAPSEDEPKLYDDVNDVDESKQEKPKAKRQTDTESIKSENVHTSAPKIDDIDSLIDTIKSDSKAKNGLSDIDNLMSKFSEELKSGKSKLNDSERTELADELTALLEDIKKKKSHK